MSASEYVEGMSVQKRGVFGAPGRQVPAKYRRRRPQSARVLRLHVEVPPEERHPSKARACRQDLLKGFVRDLVNCVRVYAPGERVNMSQYIRISTKVAARSMTFHKTGTVNRVSAFWSR